MREILFRGKRKDNGEWVEGSAINTQYDVRGEKHIYIGVLTKSEMFPLMQTITWYEVIPETVGQYTGLTDKNGKKIFDGDVLRQYSFHYVVSLKEGAFIAYETPYNDGAVISRLDWGNAVKIGNIHDNPELLKGGVQE